jgi:hypothetical protein
LTVPVVFAGPSLPPGTRSGLRLDWRPPAAAGDLLALRHEAPRTVLLLDGAFETCAAVWHKEILVLIEAGHRVFGAASMGALRAAELAPLGMVAAGRIARAYITGLIDGDEEVAVAHAPEALGFRPLAEAMVNVRATLNRAARERVIAPAAARAVRHAAHDIIYKDPDWPSVLTAARAVIDAAEFQAFSKWLPSGRIDQKRLDALAGLELALSAGAGPRPLRVPAQSPFLERLARATGG